MIQSLLGLGFGIVAGLLAALTYSFMPGIGHGGSRTGIGDVFGFWISSLLFFPLAGTVLGIVAATVCATRRQRWGLWLGTAVGLAMGIGAISAVPSLHMSGMYIDQSGFCFFASLGSFVLGASIGGMVFWKSERRHPLLFGIAVGAGAGVLAALPILAGVLGPYTGEPGPPFPVIGAAAAVICFTVVGGLFGLFAQRPYSWKTEGGSPGRTLLWSLVALLWSLVTLLACGMVALVAAVTFGLLEVRRPAPVVLEVQAEPAVVPGPSPRPFVRKDTLAEDIAWHLRVHVNKQLDNGLFAEIDDPNPAHSGRLLCVYRFAGGFPKCWAEIDSEGHKQTLGPWDSAYAAQMLREDALPKGLRGYVALFVPFPTTKMEQTYRLRWAVDHVASPEDLKPATPDNDHEPGIKFNQWRLRLLSEGIGGEVKARLPDLLPVPAADSPASSRGPKLLRPGGGRPSDRKVEMEPGHDELIDFQDWKTPAGKEVTVRLRMRFLTQQELSKRDK